MVDMYYRLVKAGLRTIQKVPDQFRDAVMINLKALEANGNGSLIQTQSVPNVKSGEINNKDTTFDILGKRSADGCESTILGVNSIVD